MKNMALILKAFALCVALIAPAMAETTLIGTSSDDFTKVRPAGSQLAGTVSQPTTLNCAAGTVASGGVCVSLSSALQSASCPTGQTMSGGNCVAIGSFASTAYPWTHYFIGTVQCGTLDGIGFGCSQINPDGHLIMDYTANYGYGGVDVGLPNYNSPLMGVVGSTCLGQGWNATAFPTGLTVTNTVPTGWAVVVNPQEFNAGNCQN